MGEETMRLPATSLLLRLAVLALLSLLSAAQGFGQTVTFPPDLSSNTVVRRQSPLILGVNVHYGLNGVRGYFSGKTGERQLQDVGATSFRDVLPWPAYAFPPSGPFLVRAQRLLRFLDITKTTPLIVLGLSNTDIDGGVPPITAAGLATFETYVAHAVTRLKPYDPIYEVWNEWNMGLGIGERMPRLSGEGDASDPRAAVHYTRIAKAAVRKIHAIDPDARVLVGATGDDRDWAWTTAVVRDGALEGATGLSVHLYNHCMRPSHRTAREMIGRLTDLQDKLRVLRNGQETPLYITEYGWPTYDLNGCGLKEPVPGYNFAQFILQSAAVPWIKGLWIYELKNSGKELNNPEHNFGLFTYKDEPRQAACFVREASALVASAEVEIREPETDVFVARITSKERQSIVLWTSSLDIKARYAFGTPASAGTMMCADGAMAAERAFGPQPVVFEVERGRDVSLEISR